MFQSLIFIYVYSTLLTWVLLSIFILDKSFTFRTLSCFDCTQINMAYPLLNLEYLLAVLAWLWSHFASILMTSKCLFKRLIWTILAFNLNMRFSFMFLFISLSNNYIAHGTLVVNLSTLNFMHTVLRYLNLAFTICTQFRVFNFNHLI